MLSHKKFGGQNEAAAKITTFDNVRTSKGPFLLPSLMNSVLFIKKGLQIVQQMKMLSIASTESADR